MNVRAVPVLADSGLRTVRGLLFAGFFGGMAWLAIGGLGWMALGIGR